MVNEMIYDQYMLKAIVTVTCAILRNNFFYSDERISWFINMFTDEIANELDFFETFAEQYILEELRTDRLARFHFTCYFTSTNLRRVFINDMHFSEQELYAFENILPKYIGEQYYYETKQGHTRKDD
jgi:hypothetical protein